MKSLDSGDHRKHGFVWLPDADLPAPGTASPCLFESTLARLQQPRLTIAIPTFKRPDLLLETVASVLAQTDLDGVELVISDDDPQSDSLDALLLAFPALRKIAFRYHRNSLNAGLFGNWNRSLALSRGEWFTLLNDDDLIDPDYVAEMRACLARDRSIVAAVCSLRFLDQRDPESSQTPVFGKAEKIRNLFRFGWRTQRKMSARKMFFGSLAGSGLGLMVRTAVIRSLGGYRAADYPSADYYFMTRLARYHHFVQLRASLAVSRVAANVSARPETQLGFLRCQARLQEALIDSGIAPRWWDRLRAPTMGIALCHINRYWNQDFDRQTVSQAIDAPITLRRNRITRWYRLLIGAV